MPALTTFIIFTTFVHFYKFFQLNILPYFYHFLPTFITFYHLYYFSPPFTTFCSILPLLSLFTTFVHVYKTGARSQLLSQNFPTTHYFSNLSLASTLYFSVPTLVFTIFPYHLPHYFFNFPPYFSYLSDLFIQSPSYFSKLHFTFRISACFLCHCLTLIPFCNYHISVADYMNASTKLISTSLQLPKIDRC